MFLYSKHFYAL